MHGNIQRQCAECGLEFAKCDASIRIKAILSRFSEILSSKHDISTSEIEKQAVELARKPLEKHTDQPADESSINIEANVNLMNDFYHIRHLHQTDRDSSTHIQFVNYLLTHSNIRHCGAQCIFTQLSTTAPGSPSHILCGIHQYFLHEHESHINENRMKYINTTFEGIDCDKMVHVLKHNVNNIQIHDDEVHMAFEFEGDATDYTMKEFMTDLCAIYTTGTNTLLSNALTNALSLKENEKSKLQEIYDSLLCCGFITMRDLNHTNFIKMLKIAAFRLHSNIKMEEIEQIAINKHLTGNLFIKGNDQFMGSLKFAKLFKSIQNFNKKRWTQIYVYIRKWTSGTTPTKRHITYESKAGINDDIIAVAQDDIDDAKHDSFNSEKLLQYYAGVAFWYWHNGKDNRNVHYILPRFDNLKNEILNFKSMSIQMWKDLLCECTLLIDVDRIRMMTSNGNNSEIYGIENDDSLTIDHILSIKLYTDYTAICSIFCKAFRLKKISHDHYERLQSLVRRHSAVAHWARLLTESVQSYGTLRVTKTKYYRGLDREYIFKEFITKYNIPLS
eukprot:208124_1